MSVKYRHDNVYFYFSACSLLIICKIRPKKFEGVFMSVLLINNNFQAKHHQTKEKSMLAL